MKTKFSFVLTMFFLFSSFSFADDVQTVIKGNNAFGFDLYQELKNQEGNIFLSPYSISTALVMTYAGARGRTEKEMANVLHYSLEQAPLHSSFSELQAHFNRIQNTGYIKLNIANSLWIQKNYNILDRFLGLCKQYYSTGLYFADFKANVEVARGTINTWVENKTQGTIKELIKKGSLSLDTTMILCNAIYFKGAWINKFDKSRTVDTDFHISSRETIKVPMMHADSFFLYKDFDSFSAIQLPYKGEGLSMAVFLPKKVEDMEKFEQRLNNDNVNSWIKELSSSYVSVSLPKFRITNNLELSKVLSKMGMKTSFLRDQADFSGITGKKNVFIDAVIHKAFVDVNEEGTEAAAATAVSVCGACYHPKTLTFQADHPFVFLIRDNKSGSILFIGRIIDPNK